MSAETDDPRSYAIIGAAMEVHRVLGPGFLEIVYQEAFQQELGLRSIPHVREVLLPITYKNLKLQAHFRADFVCYGSIIIELKALKRLSEIEDAQMINYLKVSGYQIGLLFNFCAHSLEFKRMIESRHRKGE